LHPQFMKRYNVKFSNFQPWVFLWPSALNAVKNISDYHWWIVV
jgi:hypothetical protein